MAPLLLLLPDLGEALGLELELELELPPTLGVAEPVWVAPATDVEKPLADGTAALAETELAPPVADATAELAPVEAGAAADPEPEPPPSWTLVLTQVELGPD